MWNDVKIEICKTCQGFGKTSYDELVDYHKRDYKTITEICRYCKGSGRMKTTTIVKTEPFILKD